MRPSPNIGGLVLAGAAICACTRTSYPFFQDDIVASGGAGVCAVGGCAAGGALASGGAQSSGGSGLAGDPSRPTDMAGAPSVVPEDCLIDATGQFAERIQVTESGLCFARGDFQALLGEPSYVIDLVECSTDVRQMWTLTEVETDVLQVRNYSVDLNLDVQFAATEAFTPVDLFQPIPSNQNQRFRTVDVMNGTFKLSPQNAGDQCVSTWDGHLALRPCDPSFSGQTFQPISCK